MDKNEITIFSFLTGIFFNSVTAKSISTDCRLPGVLYQGTKNVTETGRTCQRWDAQNPHEHGYDVFSIAQENYCRNFDREEPWCFTNDSGVRWELCGVDICVTPYLNMYFNASMITGQCKYGIPSGRGFCGYIYNLVSCLKENIENINESRCPQFTWRSFALQIQGTLEEFTGMPISQCILSPCGDPSVMSNSFVVINFAIPCYGKVFRNKTGNESCRVKQRFWHCVISRIQENDETNSTCLVKDKIFLANRLLSEEVSIPPEIQHNASLCENLYSEFPAPLETTTGENLYSEFLAPLETTTDTKNPVGSRETNTEFSQTTVLLAVGLAVSLIFAVSFAISIYKIRAITLRKRRKELMRLPSIPKSKDSPYEVNLTNPDSLYSDPDYEIVEEEDEGYKHLPGARVNPFTLSPTDEDGTYIDPNNADGTYLDVAQSEKEPNDYINVPAYIDLEDTFDDDHPKSDALDILLSETAETMNLSANIDTAKIMS
ncbi:uncharacterized protein LOC133204068 [Saccostrea echinata]|uniref:uncharacterized protein LOC133204068 n=1 Tax=Saccostrea echinata TaxID=191078 RepID=UPI002A83F42F|nr:uncharacterized protein LOC133204068 [Saccostrea echinata]